MPVRVLLTGFVPFHNAHHNPSGDVANALQGLTGSAPARGSTRSYAVTSRVLPVEWDTSAALVEGYLTDLDPHIAISTGMAEGTFRVERVADDQRALIRDNLNNLPAHPQSQATVRYATGLPRRAIERAIRAAGGPLSPSSDAGGFICDQVFLALMQVYRSRGPSRRLLRAGFIHVPNDQYVPSTVSSAVVQAAIQGAIEATVRDLSREEAAPTQP